MAKIERLLTQVYEEANKEIPLPEEVILPFYRDADMNRDYHIFLQEAESFYTEFIIQFEDSLGPIRFNPEK